MIIVKNYFTMFMLQMIPNTCNYVFKHDYEVKEVILLDLFLWNINIVIFTECASCISSPFEGFWMCYISRTYRLQQVRFQRLVSTQYFLK